MCSYCSRSWSTEIGVIACIREAGLGQWGNAPSSFPATSWQRFWPVFPQAGTRSSRDVVALRKRPDVGGPECLPRWTRQLPLPRRWE